MTGVQGGREQMPDRVGASLDGPTLGFYGVTPVTRPGTYTASYTATTRDLPAYTANVQSSAYTGGLLDLLQAARLTDLNALRTAVENLRALCEAAAQRENALVNDLRALGLIS